MSGFLYIYINIAILLLYIYIECARCLLLMRVIVINIYIQKAFCWQDILYTQKAKKQSFLCKKFYSFKAQILRALLSNKNRIFIFGNI